MELSLKGLAKLIDAGILGRSDRIITGVSSFEDAKEHHITFASDPKFLKKLNQCNAGAIIVPDDVPPDTETNGRFSLLTCPHPKISFFRIAAKFHPEKKRRPGIDATARIGKSPEIGHSAVIAANVFVGDHVRIGDNVHLMPNVYIGDHVTIKDHVTVKPNVTIMEKTHIGSNVIIHPGAVIGSDGYGFVQGSGEHEKLHHYGYVHIHDDVEIGANTTIDRGTLGKTIIGRGVKIDNLVHIAHNVKIGDHALILAQVGIAGSAAIGANVIVAGKAGISGHISIGANTIVGPFAGVHSNVGENEIVSGMPQMPHSRWRKVVSIISRLPEMRKQLFSFEKRIKKIEEKNHLTENE